MRSKQGDQLFSREEYPYYEDTHDLKGNYTGSAMPNKPNQVVYGEEQKQAFYEPPKALPKQPPLAKQQTTASRNFSNVVVYEPRTPDDVQTLIDYLKRKEPAIINLDTVEDKEAQRILDFFSGAVYALSGSIHRISGNIFLLTPEGVVITAPL